MRGGCGVSTYLIFTFVHTLYHTYLPTYIIRTYIRLIGTYIPTYIRLISNEFFKISFRMLVSARASLLQDRRCMFSRPQHRHCHRTEIVDEALAEGQTYDQKYDGDTTSRPGAQDSCSSTTRSLCLAGATSARFRGPTSLVRDGGRPGALRRAESFRHGERCLFCE